MPNNTRVSYLIPSFYDNLPWGKADVVGKVERRTPSGPVGGVAMACLQSCQYLLDR
jgi:hypothetical protein